MPRKRDTEAVRDPRTGHWAYDYYDDYGVRHRGSLRLPKKASQREANAKFHELKIQWEQQSARRSWNESLDLAVERQGIRRSPRTVAKYRDAVSHLAAYCDKRGIIYLDEIGPQQISELFGIIAVNHAPMGVNSIRSSMRTLFNILHRWGHMPADYDSERWFKDARQPEQKRERIFSETELHTLFADAVFGDVFRLLYLTGARSGELISVHISNVGEKTITFPFSKGRDTRTAPLSTEARQFIEQRLSAGDERLMHDYIVWRSEWGNPDDNGDGNNYGDRGRAQYRLLHRLKKIAKDKGWQPCRIHDLRATTATHLAPRVSMLVLMQIMGWENARTAQDYYRETADQVAFPTLPASGNIAPISRTMVATKNKSN